MEYEHGMTGETKGTEHVCRGDQQEDRVGSGRCHSWVRMWATLQGRQLRTGFETMVVLCTHTKKTQETVAKAHEDGAISPNFTREFEFIFCINGGTGISWNYTSKYWENDEEFWDNNK